MKPIQANYYVTDRLALFRVEFIPAGIDGIGWQANICLLRSNCPVQSRWQNRSEIATIWRVNAHGVQVMIRPSIEAACELARDTLRKWTTEARTAEADGLD